MPWIKDFMKKKYTLWFVAVIFAAVVFNGIFCCFYFRSQEYTPVNSRLLSRQQISDARQRLLSCDRDNLKYLSYSIQSESDKISLYAHVLHMNQSEVGRAVLLQSYSNEELADILSSFSYTEAEANERLATLAYCQERLAYVKNYPNYIRIVQQNVQVVTETGIFDELARKNAIKAERAFLGHEDIMISAEPDIGVNKLFSSSVSDIIAILLMFLCSLIYCLRCRTRFSKTVLTKSNFAAFSGAATIGLGLLYAEEALICDHFFTLGDLSRSLQSVEIYKTCPYLVSVSFLLLVRILFKTLTGLIIYFFLVSAFFCRRPIAAGLFALLALTAELLPDPPGMALSLYQTLHPEHLLTRYNHFYVFRELLNPALALTLFLLCLLICGALLAVRQVSAALLAEKSKAERSYYDEVNRTYTEVRLIRHDINNHLSAVALLMDEGRMDEARDYLGKITERLSETTPPVKTGSSVLDAILLGKTNAAEERGITIQMNFLTGLADCGISDFDLCSVFGNLLDNAIDACEKLPEPDRHILLEVREQMDMICVYCENRYAALRPENGSFATLKTDKGAHGLGLRQVRHLAEKHGGMLHVDTENGVFSISVLFHRGIR